MIFFLKAFFVLSVIIGLIFFNAPTNVNLSESGLAPFLTWSHPLGCDKLGRDIYALYAFGTFTTFLISIPARVITLLASVLIAFMSYASNKYINFVIASFAAVFLSLPSF